MLAVALAFSGTAAFGAAMGDVVTTRSDQNISEQYGRDSVYAFSPAAKPLKPEQTEARDTNIFGKLKSYTANAWHKTEHFAGATWGAATGFFTHHPATSSSVALYEPQPYGRAGGYVGPDRIAILQSNATALTANSDVVWTGESKMGNVADKRGESEPVAPSAQESSMGSPDREQSALNSSGDIGATNSSGYTQERDPERTPNDAVPTDSMGDVSATDSSGYTNESDPERMPNDLRPQ